MPTRTEANSYLIPTRTQLHYVTSIILDCDRTFVDCGFCKYVIRVIRVITLLNLKETSFYSTRIIID